MWSLLKPSTFLHGLRKSSTVYFLLLQNMIDKESFIEITDALRRWNRADFHMSNSLQEYGVNIENELNGRFLEEVVKIFENQFNDKSHAGTEDEPHGRDSAVSSWIYSLESSDDFYRDGGELYDFLITNRSLNSAGNAAAPEGE